MKEEKATSTSPEDKAKLQSNSNFNRPKGLLGEEEMAGIVKSSQNLECCFSPNSKQRYVNYPKHVPSTCTKHFSSDAACLRIVTVMTSHGRTITAGESKGSS